MKIQQYKMHAIANRLNAAKTEKAEKLEAAAVDAATKFILDQIPDEVKEFFAKWPNAGSDCCQYVFVEGHNGSLGFYSHGVKGSGAAKITRSISSGSQEAKLFTQAVESKRDAGKTKERIFCALQKIGTYAKLKNEWPEAYAILCEIDGKEVKDKQEQCACDDIEKLRAELKSKKA